jgi:3',5'-cyclic AMP phosphodiesterase CpdA
MPQHFAQISDPHLTSLIQVSVRELLNKRALGYLSWRRKRRFEHRGEVLAALQQDLEKQSLDQLLITGDLTHIGLPSEFQQARTWLQALGTPSDVGLVPGNHDTCVRAPWEQTFALWADYMAGDKPATHSARAPTFPTLRVRGDIAFIGLKTGVPTPPLMATGTAGKAQLERLAPLLRDVHDRGLFRVVYLHHCPIKGTEKWRKRLTDAADVQRILKAAGAELIIHGHGHRKHHLELETRDGTAPVIAVPSASALGLHGADVAEYNRYSVERSEDGWRLDINTRRYDKTLDSFTEGESNTLQLQRTVPKT